MKSRLLGLILCALLLPLAAHAQLANNRGTPLVSANTTNCTLIAAGNHTLVGFSMGNTSTVAFIKFYDSATAPTAGQGTPYSFEIPGNAAGAGSNLGPLNLSFQKGLGFCVTGGAANSDATAVASSQIVGTIVWQ